MLRQIQSDVFKDISPIDFNDGLNVILGDGSNSIGKTSLLKVIDFAFGGKYYTDSSDDIIKNVGHHDICFSHEFENEIKYFRRNTRESKTVYICSNKNYQIVDQIEISTFNSFLLDNMNIKCKDIGFRDLVGLYSRIWSKPNRDVNHPLFLYNHQTVKESILNLIKTFDFYETVKKNQEKLNRYTDTDKAYKAAQKYNIINSINKAQYNINIKRLESIKSEMLNLEKVISIIKQDEELVLIEKHQDLFSERQNILRIINKYKRELHRIQDNLSSKYNVTNKYSFDSLKEFFPTINISKLSEISNFHENIKNILHYEFVEANENIEIKINNLEKQLDLINQLIRDSREVETKTTIFVEKIKELVYEKSELESINKNYSEQLDIKIQKKSSKSDLEKELLGITKNIESLINNRIFCYASQIQSKNNRAPVFELKNDSYSFGVQDNTGTGKAYTDLILFDLAVLALTELPFLIHDSFLFNNIGQDTIGSFIKLYSSINNKQMFISVDKMYEYDNDVQEILVSTSRRFFSNTNQLYRVDWR